MAQQTNPPPISLEYGEAIGVACNAKSNSLRVFADSVASEFETLDARALAFPMPILETRRFRLRVRHQDKDVWLSYREVRWQRFMRQQPSGAAEVDAQRGAFGAEDVQRLCSSG